MSIERMTVNRATSELIDIAPQFVRTHEGADDNQGGRVLLLVLPIIVSQEGVNHEYTNLWQLGREGDQLYASVEASGWALGKTQQEIETEARRRLQGGE